MGTGWSAWWAGPRLPPTVSSADDLMYVAEAGAQSTAAFRRVAGGQVRRARTGPGGGRIERHGAPRRPGLEPREPCGTFPPVDRETLKTKTIGVLMGGLSGEREVSLRSGRNCLRALLASGYRAVEIDALQDVGRRLEEAGVEVAFLALHGRYGEDGTIQGLLELMGIPYTGSGVLASALGMNKVAAKKVVAGSGLPTPGYCEVAAGESARAAPGG